ncbi:MAG TPA: ribonuclease PH [Dehalococcoidia bacterium]|nr:ribonuclease PH [Dehalococcoidia bacterium]
MERIDGRKDEELRVTTIQPSYQLYAEGSALITAGNTKVICSASVEDKVPPFLKGSGSGWVTAEYSMLPRATNTRNRRDRESGKISGRSQEIQRLIGRSLRGIIDLKLLGEFTINIDCDVIQADGGTRTASINGSYIALSQAIYGLINTGKIQNNPIINNVCAVSIALLDKRLLVDPCYEEDSQAEVDFNIVMSGDQQIIELQGGTEAGPFDVTYISQILTLASTGTKQLKEIQDASLKEYVL